jgi:ribosomal protein S18 acetylase RimI-like enzyme
MELRLDEPPATDVWPAGVSLRLADVGADADAVHDLLELTYREAGDRLPPLDEWLIRWTEDSDFDPTAWFLAEVESDIVGVALCWKTGFVKDLAVHPAHRRRGIGRALLLHVIDEFRRRGVAAIELKVDASNAAALALYESLGMRVVERLRH